MDTWRKLQNLKQAVHQVIKQRLNASDDILIIGGEKDTSSKVERYSPSCNRWWKCKNSPKPCTKSAVAVNGTYVYVAGGIGNLGNILVYNIDVDAWKMVDYPLRNTGQLTVESVLNTPRSHSSAAVINNKLYVIGGWSYKSACLSTGEVFLINGYQCTADEKEVPSLSGARSDHASVVVGSTIYILGGWNGKCYLSTFESINVETGNRCSLAPLHEARYELAAVSFNKTILAIGGFNSSGRLSNIESYCIETKQWTIMPPMMSPRQGHCACVIDDVIYIIGGCDTNFIETCVPASWTLCFYRNLRGPRVFASANVI